MIPVLLLLLIINCGMSFKTYIISPKNNIIAFQKLFNLKSSNVEEFENNEVKPHKSEFFHFGFFPRLEYPNDKGQLTWYPIGFSKDFGIKPKKVTIRDVNFVVWKDKTTYYGIRDCCSHQGSSFMLGETCKNTIS